eukprot:CAMPEP_0116064282 /NCGR_PEP_ID=MMETSP0322-20121206/8999_1 /TAXON_ID=163516 /ORGANISM="Leptocylindrus danicus var. apora, Strain B651" /LENGTH=1125 /DNA_ID=CAMNT_0003550225 /DNA_START=115 /DNA_END=3489 /DNA_ORIENTATION=-
MAGETWEIAYMTCVLLFMFIALLSDRIGPDHVMLMALTLCMASGIITIEEGLEGFSNEGLLTVLALFVVAAGIGHTGALDWYMGKLLGTPKNTAGGQIRLMLPIAAVSAFLNNTPVVAVMIPIVQRWGKNVGINPQQLLVPLSFASILGGTCTLIGTSTNLVVVGLLKEEYPDDNDISIGLFDIGWYGIPIAFIGVTYILLASPFLLPGGSRSGDSNSLIDDIGNDLLLGGRLTRWSTAAGRTVKRSGLRDTGGIYLVSVLRAATGNIHRAVGQDFVLNVGDILYFTGFVEEFGAFCHEHGLELVTNEVENEKIDLANKLQHEEKDSKLASFSKRKLSMIAEEVEDEGGAFFHDGKLGETGTSLVQSENEVRLRSINKVTDMIRGNFEVSPDVEFSSPVKRKRKLMKTVSTLFNEHDPSKIIIVKDVNVKIGDKPMVLVAINTRDRPGLLLDISKGLLRLSLQLHHSEAAVIGSRSLSVWRCEELEGAEASIEESWSVLNAMLESQTGAQAIKERGLRVLRAVVTKGSRLIGKSAIEVNFRETYKAAIVAYHRQKSSEPKQSLSSVKFDAGDVLVLQVNDDSALLVDPPGDFYKNLEQSFTKESRKRSNSGSSLSSMLRSLSQSDILASKKRSKSRLDEVDTQKSLEGKSDNDSVSLSKHDDNSSFGSSSRQLSLVDEKNDFGLFSDDTIDSDEVGHDQKVDIDMEMSNTMLKEEVWADLRVIKSAGTEKVSKEFLSAMEVSHNSQFIGKSAAQTGLNKLSGVYLVEIERPLRSLLNHAKTVISAPDQAIQQANPQQESHSMAISADDVLGEGDILWFSGSASAIGDLRKVPGIQPVEERQVNKIDGSFNERRLVQAVVAKQGPLVGKTVKDVRFRTTYGAAVIAVQREGNRVHDHPGRVNLQAGDVLLLEAGPSFVAKNANKDKSFALLNEVKDSAPPRLKLLIPALLLTIAALGVYTANLATLLVCSLIAGIMMVWFGILTQQEARDAINWEVFVTIAAAFGIGTALTNSGLAENVADFLVLCGDAVNIGDAGLLGAVYFATFLISNVVTNNAAAALIFPIAINAAEQKDIDVIVMSYSVMLGASASFMSPFGYTTNLLIYGPGSYTYSDFLRMGTPMQIVLW